MVLASSVYTEICKTGKKIQNNFQHVYIEKILVTWLFRKADEKLIVVAFIFLIDVWSGWKLGELRNKHNTFLCLRTMSVCSAA